MHSVDDPSLAGIVADSPFSDLWELMTEVCARHVPLPSFLISPLMHFVRFVVQRKAGFDIREVSPQASIDRCFVPLLLLRGEKDEFTTPWHVDTLKRGCRGEVLRLEMPGATHISARPDEFIARAAVFLVRALRWEKHLPPNVVDTGAGFIVQEAVESIGSDAADLDELPLSPHASLGRHCPGASLSGRSEVLPKDALRALPQDAVRVFPEGALRVLPVDSGKQSSVCTSLAAGGKISDAEFLASSLASVCFGSSPPSLRCNTQTSLASCSPKNAATVSSSRSPKHGAAVSPMCSPKHGPPISSSCSPKHRAAVSSISLPKSGAAVSSSHHMQVTDASASDRTAVASASPDAASSVTPRTAAGKGPPPPRKGLGKGPPASKGKKEGKASKGKKEGKGSSSTSEPCKPDVIPRIPLRKLFWTPIALESNADSGVWGNIHRKGGANFDRDELEALFAQNGKAAAGARAAEKPKPKPKTVRKHLLEEQRRRQLWCMLAKMPEQEEMLKAVTDMHNEVLSPDAVHLLLSNLPNSTEEALLKAVVEAEEEIKTEDWEVPEEFLLKLVGIPEYALRVKVWAFLCSAEEALARMSMAEQSARAACECLRGSSRIEKLLAVALYVGNYLNGGTPRGCADGFELENLKKLAELKAAQQTQGTLLDFIVAQVEKDSPGMLRQIYSPGGEFEHVNQVFKINMTEMKEELCQLCNHARGHLRKFGDLVGSSAGSVDNVSLRKRQAELQSRVHQFEEMCTRFDDWEESYTQLCKWFRVDTKKKETSATNEFFGLWEIFLSDVRKALSSLEKKQQQRERADPSAISPRVTSAPALPRSPRLQRQQCSAKQQTDAVAPRPEDSHGTAKNGSKRALSRPRLHRALSGGA